MYYPNRLIYFGMKDTRESKEDPYISFTVALIYYLNRLIILILNNRELKSFSYILSRPESYGKSECVIGTTVYPLARHHTFYPALPTICPKTPMPGLFLGIRGIKIHLKIVIVIFINIKKNHSFMQHNSKSFFYQ